MNTVYLIGMAIPLVYIFMYLLGGALRPGYNHIKNSVSELLSPGAPNKKLLTTIQIIYALLHIIFGFGVWLFIRGSAGDQMIGLLGACFIMVLGVITLGTAIFPQDAEGSKITRAGQAHKFMVFGGLIPLSILSTLFVGIWFTRTDLISWFDEYSYVTVGAVFVMGGVGGAMAGTRFAGLVERIAALVTQQWLFMLGLLLLLH